MAGHSGRSAWCIHVNEEEKCAIRHLFTSNGWRLEEVPPNDVASLPPGVTGHCSEVLEVVSQVSSIVSPVAAGSMILHDMAPGSLMPYNPQSAQVSPEEELCQASQENINCMQRAQQTEPYDQRSMYKSGSCEESSTLSILADAAEIRRSSTVRILQPEIESKIASEPQRKKRRISPIPPRPDGNGFKPVDKPSTSQSDMQRSCQTGPSLLKAMPKSGSINKLLILAEAASKLDVRLIVPDDERDTWPDEERKSVQNEERDTVPDDERDNDERNTLPDIRERRELEEENRHLREQTTCQICTANPRDIVLLPCGHVICCSTCAYQLQNCPICRMSIRNKL